MEQSVQPKLGKCAKCGAIDEERISVAFELNRGIHKRHVIPVCTQCVEAFLPMAEFTLVPKKG